MILVFLIEGRKLCPYLVQMAPISWLQAETMLARARAPDVSKNCMKIFEKSNNIISTLLQFRPPSFITFYVEV